MKDSLTIIKENRSIFKDSNINHSEKLYKDIIEIINEISDSEDNCIIINNMRNIGIKLDNFLAELKDLKDISRYN